MKKLLLLLALALFPLALPADFPDAPFIPLWEGVPMPGPTTPGEEIMKNGFVPGKKNQSFVIENVSNPAIQFYKAASETPTAAVIVCPGGAYRSLQYGHEGVDVANLLVGHGISAFILKYRVPNEFKEKDRVYMDAQRAIRLIRFNAQKWNVDPAKVGIIGFSAGGHLAAWMSTNYAKNTYEPLDAADQLPTRPDFAAMVYGAWLNDKYNKENSLALATDLPVNAQTTPAFLVHCVDDKTITADSSLAYYLALKAQKVPADLHVFDKGGHGHGIRQRGWPIDAWPQLYLAWIKERTAPATP